MPCDPGSNRRCGTRTACVKLATGQVGGGNQTPLGNYASGRLTRKTKRNNNNILKVATWNVQGLNKTGKLEIVENASKSIAILGISETHWKQTGHFISSNGNYIIAASNPNQSKNGVAIIVNKDWKDAIMGYDTVSDRIVTMKMSSKPININIIMAYAPTSACSVEELDQFYNLLRKTVNSIPNRELLLVLGDYNAKVGDTKDDDHIREVVGKHGIGVRNERGEHFLDFCSEMGLFIANTNFSHHPRRTYTWRSPDGFTRNQIDYVLVRNRWKSCIKDVKTYPGMDC